MNDRTCQWESLKHFNRPISVMTTMTAPKCAAIEINRLWGILIPCMWPCGWHGTTKVAIPFHSSAIFHPAPFVFHLQKQNCSPFSSCENMASQKALWGISITRMCVLWLPQHGVSDSRYKKKTLDNRVIALEITRSAVEFMLKICATG